MTQTTATPTTKRIEVGPTCACGKKDYCDYSCMRSRIAPQARYPMPAEDESFADWQDRRSINGGR